jgi:hypothetical protein
MRQPVKICLPSDEETQESYGQVPSGNIRRSANKFKMVVVPLRRDEHIKYLYTVGENVRRIIREEASNLANVRNADRLYNAGEYIEEVRMELYGLVETALASIRYALETKKDHKLANRLLLDLAAIRKSARALY